MSVWSGIAGTLGKVFSTAGTVMSAIPGLGTVPGVAASAAGGLLGQMASEQNQKDFYNQQLVYNSPKEQMKRLQEAGLNPNLVYGTTGVTGMSASDATAPNLEQYRENPLLKMTPQQIQEMAIQRKHQENENRITDSNISLNKEKERTEVAKQDNLNSDTYKTGQEGMRIEKWNTELFDIQKKTMEYQRDLMYSSKEEANLQLNILTSTYDRQVQQVYEDLQHTIKQNKVLDATEQKIIAETLKVPFEILALRASAGLANQEALKFALDNDWLQQVSTDSNGNKVPNYYRVNEAKLRDYVNTARGKHLNNLFGNGNLGSFFRFVAGLTNNLPKSLSTFGGLFPEDDNYTRQYNSDEYQRNK